MSNLTVSLEYAGYSDYWGGNGRRWDHNAGCLFACYNGETTLRDLVDQWVEDYGMNGEHDADCWENISSADVRHAIVNGLLNDRGRADYDSGALCAWAEDCEDNRVCSDCGEPIGEAHGDDCPLSVDLDGNEGYTSAVMQEDCDDFDCCIESPYVIILLELEVCPDCDNPSGENTHDGLCDQCEHANYGGQSGSSD